MIIEIPLASRKRLEIDILTPIKGIAKMNDFLDVIVNQIWEKYFRVKTIKEISKNFTIVPSAESVCQ
jgi:hypothetical protein